VVAVRDSGENTRREQPVLYQQISTGYTQNTANSIGPNSIILCQLMNMSEREREMWNPWHRFQSPDVSTFISMCTHHSRDPIIASELQQPRSLRHAYEHVETYAEICVHSLRADLIS